MDFIEFKNKSAKELTALLEENKKLLYNERLQGTKESHKIGEYKKTIAQILTILHSRKD